MEEQFNLNQTEAETLSPYQQMHHNHNNAKLEKLKRDYWLALRGKTIEQFVRFQINVTNQDNNKQESRRKRNRMARLSRKAQRQRRK